MITKGVDVVGWIGCAKQKELGPGRFVAFLKKAGRSAKAVSAGSVPSIPPNAAGLSVERRRQLQTYQEVRTAAGEFAKGTPECAACGLSGGKPYGCYTFIGFPIDEAAEKALFDYFASQVAIEGSPAAAIYRDVVSKAPTTGTRWHEERGGSGNLAETEHPHVKEWGFLMWKKHLDSAQILGTIFFTQRRPALIAAVARFWDEFMTFARTHVAQIGASTTMRDLLDLHAFYERAAEVSATTDGMSIFADSDAALVHPEQRQHQEDDTA